MKKYFFALFIFTLGLMSCQDEPNKETVKTEKKVKINDSIKLLKGEFIFVDNAAVLKGANFIYGIKIDSMAMELAVQTDSVKKDEFDMVPVVLKGVVKQNKRTKGWEEIVTIKKIVKVSKSTPDSINGNKK